jgi:hypothetical protein
MGLYLLTSPGRIDFIDGQRRYEVAKNWLDQGEPVVTDHYLGNIGVQLVNRRTGQTYSVYNAAPSLTPMPLMALSRLLPHHTPQRDQLAFSLTGPLFGALLGALLLLGYGALGIPLRQSLISAAIFCMATLWWPSSVTVFDQNQHGVLLLGAVFLAWLAGRRQSLQLAALAGLLAGLLINYQEMYALLLPAVGLAVLAAPEEGSSGEAVVPRRSVDRQAILRCLTFALCCCIGFGLYIAFNEVRLGTPFALAKYGPHDGLVPPTWGSPLAGFLSLALSPGKGILWFSPPLLCALLGARGMFRRAPTLALAVAGVSVIHLLVIVHLTFFGGDWCWGPRYAVPVMPLWALAFPFATRQMLVSRRVIAPLAAAGFLIQVAGVSIDTQRFFYERNLRSYFWALDPWCYFKQSQLAARPFEILSSITTGLPKQAVYFSPAPNQPQSIPLTPTDAEPARLWMRHFQIFYLPRPWWGWVSRILPEQRPVDPGPMSAVCAASLILGGILVFRALRATDSPTEAAAGPASKDLPTSGRGQPVPSAGGPDGCQAPGGSLAR